ncbi:MAG: hypothetical protein ACXWFE_12750, partial [Solirubrobacterales bacterium]
MTDTDFDFDFDVGRGAGTSERSEPGREDRSPASDDGAGNGPPREGERDDDDNGRAPLERGPEPPPLVRAEQDSEPAPPRRGNGAPGSPGEEGEPSDATGDPDDDWLRLADDDLRRSDLSSVAAPDDGPAGPPRPREGRELARNARLRAIGREPEPESAPAPAETGEADAGRALGGRPPKGASPRRGA